MKVFLEESLPIIVQNFSARLMVIVGLKPFFGNDLSEGNGYGVSLGQDIPV